MANIEARRGVVKVGTGRAQRPGQAAPPIPLAFGRAPLVGYALERRPAMRTPARRRVPRCMSLGLRPSTG